MNAIYDAFFDEMSKIAASALASLHVKARRGRRPIRASKILSRNLYAVERGNAGRDAATEDADTMEHEAGRGVLEKEGSRRRDRAIGVAASVRPWVKSGVGGAIPAAVAANFLVPATSPKWLKRKSKLLTGATLLGAAAGMSNHALEQWAAAHKRRSVARQILKTSAMAGDLRAGGIGGVRRPQFPTEGSKDYSESLRRKSSRIGRFDGRTTRKILSSSGPGTANTGLA